MTEDKQKQPYFPHYANSRNEDRLSRLRMKLGPCGYGVYYMLLERLRLADDYRCELDYEVLAWDLRCDEELIKSVILDFGLFEIVEDGLKFQSIELSAYMEFMAEKKRKRTEAAKAAANARWGNRSEVVDTPNTTEEGIIDFENKVNTKGKKLTLEEELEIMKGDKAWLRAVSQRSGKDVDTIMSYFPEFSLMCITKGQTNGHVNIQDAMSHFCSWMEKTGKNALSGITGNKAKTKSEIIEEKRQQDILRQQKQRDKEYKKWKEDSMKPDDYIRNKGYDPAEVTLSKLFQPHFMENNPPTHPEWIGQYSKKALTEQVEEVSF